jgi:ribose transport system substrate-binding protein
MAMLVVLAALSLVVAACGSSDSSSTAADTTAADTTASSTQSSAAAPDGVAEARQMVEEALGTPEWKGPDAPIDVSSLKGKTIWAISLDLAIPHMNTITESMKEAAEAAGAKVMVFDGKSQVSEWARGVEQAISAKADAIVPIAVGFDTIKAPLEKAKQAGIPVIAGLYTDAGEPIPPKFEDIVSGQVTEQYSRAGALEAAWTIADSDGKANVLAIDVPGIDVSKPVVQGIKDTFDRLCPDCKVTWKQAPTSEWTKLGTLVRSALTSDPSIDYVIPLYDGMATFVVPGVHQAGAADRVKVSSFNATAAILEMLERGDVVAADSGTQGPWEGWALVDASFRAMLDEAPVDNYEIPLRLFTEENIDSIDISKGEAAWYGPLDYAGKFKSLWGVE